MAERSIAETMGQVGEPSLGRNQGASRQANISKLLVAALTIQLVFWFAMKPLLFETSQPGDDAYDVYQVSEAAIDAPSFDATTKAKFSAIDQLPAENCCELGYRALKMHFDVGTIPEYGLAIAPRSGADNFRLYLNGSFLGGTGEIELGRVTYDSLKRDTFLIPPGLLKDGKNELVMIMVRDGVPYFDFKQPLISEYQAFSSRYARMEFHSKGYKFMTLAAMIVISLFALLVLLRATDKRQPATFFLLALSWTMVSLFYAWPSMPLRGTEHILFYFVGSLAVPFFWLSWADSWSNSPAKWLIWPASVLFVGLLAAIVSCLYLLPTGPGYDWAGHLLDYGTILFAITTVVRIVWSFRFSFDDRYWEAAIAILLAVLLILQALTELTSSVNAGYVGRSQPFLIIGLAVAFFARNYRLFQSSAQINSLLQSQLCERTADLEASHEREKQLVRQQAHHSERQRLMRDMHDGLGSDMMSMLLAARLGDAKPEAVAEGLQSMVDEMRLIIDSMDSVGESLASALSTFRSRVQGRVESAGFAFKWVDEAGRNLPELQPRQLLQIFRIMQEAVNNALKHSQGNKISVEITRGEGANSMLRIRISDNGIGLSAKEVIGHGLDNMRTRAAAIGASIAFENGDPGARVTLNFAANSTQDAGVYQ